MSQWDEVYIKAAERYMSAVKALGERSPDTPNIYLDEITMSPERIARWTELSNAGIELNNCLSILKSNASSVLDYKDLSPEARAFKQSVFIAVLNGLISRPKDNGRHARHDHDLDYFRELAWAEADKALEESGIELSHS